MKVIRADVERYHSLSGGDRRISFIGVLLGCFRPRMIPVALIRLAEYFYRRHLGPLGKICAMVNVVLFGIEVSPRVEIGGGLFLPHTVGTVIGAEKIGQCVTIMQGVTLGAKEQDLAFTPSLRPVIGDHVTIGAGAKIIGRVIVGDFSTIGANAVVTHDIPPYSVAVGVPARVISRVEESDSTKV